MTVRGLIDRILWLAFFALVISAGGVPAQAQPVQFPRCHELSGLELPNVSIDSAAVQGAGALSLGKGKTVKQLPSFCRVSATARPSVDSIIHFEVWIPVGARWNGRFLGVGNNAFLGAPNYQLMADALRRGFATASTDTGHKGGELSFAVGHPEKIVDWAYRSIHVTAQNAKLILRAATGRLPVHSYFNGCNTGGHQALMEAQRFPSDYDGIVAGAPAADRVHEIIGYLGIWKATHDAAGKSLLSHADLQLITAGAMAACDTLDGVRDGVIGNPSGCAYDPARLRCAPRQRSGCLDDAQINAALAVYRGIRNPRTGRQIFAGWPVGSEGFGATTRDGWDSLVNGPSPRRSEFFNNFVFDNPNWDWHTFDFDRDTAFSDQKMGFISAIDPDLHAFAARKAKLLMYGGWVDPILPADEVIDYYEAIRRAMGAAETDAFVRFYMIPGYAHCNGGPGTTDFDMVTPLVKWVEQGIAPERISARHLSVDRNSEFSRPLCRFPAFARWTGRGDDRVAATFVCKAATP